MGYRNTGSAYYRFGDVIARDLVDTDGYEYTEYWICVRPAFGPEGKGDSHWASVSRLSSANRFEYTSSHNRKYTLPTGIGKSEVHMQNFAEMLFAIYNPEQWFDNVINYGPQGMPMFDDFDRDKISLHNKVFWQRVHQAWVDKEIADSVFTMSDTKLKGQVTYDQEDWRGLFLLHSGLSWWKSKSNNLTLYVAHYYNTPRGVHSNMHAAKPLRSIKKQVVYPNNPENDITSEGTTT